MVHLVYCNIVYVLYLLYVCTACMWYMDGKTSAGLVAGPGSGQRDGWPCRTGGRTAWRTGGGRAVDGRRPDWLTRTGLRAGLQLYSTAHQWLIFTFTVGRVHFIFTFTVFICGRMDDIWMDFCIYLFYLHLQYIYSICIYYIILYYCIVVFVLKYCILLFCW